MRAGDRTTGQPANGCDDSFDNRDDRYCLTVNIYGLNFVLSAWAPLGKRRFYGPDFRAFDDNLDDNRGFSDDNRVGESSPTCSNRVPIEPGASRCTASITSA